MKLCQFRSITACPLFGCHAFFMWKQLSRLFGSSGYRIYWAFYSFVSQSGKLCKVAAFWIKKKKKNYRGNHLILSDELEKKKSFRNDSEGFFSMCKSNIAPINIWRCTFISGAAQTLHNVREQHDSKINKLTTQEACSAPRLLLLSRLISISKRCIKGGPPTGTSMWCGKFI